MSQPTQSLRSPRSRLIRPHAWPLARESTHASQMHMSTPMPMPMPLHLQNQLQNRVALPNFHIADRLANIFLFIACSIVLGYAVYCGGTMVTEHVVGSKFGVPWLDLRRIGPYVHAKEPALAFRPPAGTNSACCSERESLLRKHFTAARVSANGLEVGDLVFAVHPRRPWMRVLGTPRSLHAMMYVGAVNSATDNNDHNNDNSNANKNAASAQTEAKTKTDAQTEAEAEASFVHLAGHGFRYSRMARLWDEGGTLFVRKLRCPADVRAKILQSVSTSVKTQVDPNTKRPLFLAATPRGVRLIAGRQDNPSLGFTCTTALFTAYSEAGVLTRPVTEFWSPRDTLFEPSEAGGSLPWAAGCGLEPVRRWFDISNQEEL